MLERALWERLGLRLEDLASRPWREVKGYLTIMELEVQVEKQAADLARFQASRRQQTRG